MTKQVDPFNDHNAHLKAFPPEVLRDIARNDAADRQYRKAAFEILFSRKHPYAKHPDFRYLAQELEIELEGIQFEFPAPSEGAGPLTAGVTTKTMFGDPEVIDNLGRSSEDPVISSFTAFDFPDPKKSTIDLEKDTNADEKPRRTRKPKDAPTSS